MFANKSIILILIVSALVMTGCASEPVPTVLPEPTSIVITESPTPVVQLDDKEEMIVQIVSSEIVHKRPFLIAVSEVSKRNLWQGVSPKIKDMEKCWIVEIDVVTQCDSENIRNFIGNPNALKIFFASAYSDSLGELFILDYHHPPAPYDTSEEDMQDTVDGYRLVLDLQEGTWAKKSLKQVY